MVTQEKSPELDAYILNLERITIALKVRASLIIFSGIMNLSLLGLALLTYRGVLNFPSGLLMFAATLGFAAMFITIYSFEQSVKTGDTIFNEISDELEWNIKSKGNLYGESYTGIRPVMKYRVVLRDFVKSSDLPFLGGRGGASIWMLQAILMWISIVALIRV